ncbi:MAG: hypothetical protein K2H85_05720, partial [Allobaculum sp.]|nr:hypothetical protein [Allobaculum sp.]
YAETTFTTTAVAASEDEGDDLTTLTKDDVIVEYELTDPEGEVAADNIASCTVYLKDEAGKKGQKLSTATATVTDVTSGTVNVSVAVTEDETYAETTFTTTAVAASEDEGDDLTTLTKDDVIVEYELTDPEGEVAADNIASCTVYLKDEAGKKGQELSNATATVTDVTSGTVNVSVAVTEDETYAETTFTTTAVAASEDEGDEPGTSTGYAIELSETKGTLDENDECALPEVTVTLDGTKVTEGFTGKWTDKDGNEVSGKATAAGDYTYTVTPTDTSIEPVTAAFEVKSPINANQDVVIKIGDIEITVKASEIADPVSNSSANLLKAEIAPDKLKDVLDTNSQKAVPSKNNPNVTNPAPNYTFKVENKQQAAEGIDNGEAEIPVTAVTVQISKDSYIRIVIPKKTSEAALTTREVREVAEESTAIIAKVSDVDANSDTTLDTQEIKNYIDDQAEKGTLKDEDGNAITEAQAEDLKTNVPDKVEIDLSGEKDVANIKDGYYEVTASEQSEEPGTSTGYAVTLAETTGTLDENNECALPTPTVTLNGEEVTTGFTGKWTDSENNEVTDTKVTAVGEYTYTVTPEDTTIDPVEAKFTVSASGTLGNTGTGTSGSSTHKKPKPKPEEPANPVVGTPTPMYRLYNKLNGEHLFTTDKAERDNLLTSDTWSDEGQGWTAPSVSDTPVYRLLNPNTGDHHYTTDKNEFDTLPSYGWIAEGVAFFSADKDNAENVILHRLYNPNAKGAGSHHYTADTNERDTLVAQGWKYEGTAWAG